MKAARFEYLKPKDVPEAITALATASGEAKPLGGGQSLGPMLNLRLARPKLIVDVSRLEALRRVEDLGHAWRIGGAVTHSRLEDEELAGCEMLAYVAGTIAYRSIRNRGTIGGSLAHADPAADWPLALAALGARVVLRGSSGERVVPVGGFVRGAFTTVLADDELIVAVEVPKLSLSSRWGYWKFCRKTGEFPEAAAALVLDPEKKTARLWIGALNGAPQGLERLAEEVARRGSIAATAQSVGAAIESAVPDLDPAQRRVHVHAVQQVIQKGFS